MRKWFVGGVAVALAAMSGQGVALLTREIKSEHLYFDQVTFLAQLGLMPGQPTT
jgi:hypothetical protein